MEPFLKPLSAQEEKSCLDAYQRGDTKARDILVERNLRLVAHVVKKYQGLPDDLDDLISIGTIGLIKAVDLFDIYTGSGIPEGKKSVAFNLTLRSDDRSLTAQEADEDVKSILETLKAELNAVLR